MKSIRLMQTRHKALRRDNHRGAPEQRAILASAFKGIGKALDAQNGQHNVPVQLRWAFEQADGVYRVKDRRTLVEFAMELASRSPFSYPYLSPDVCQQIEALGLAYASAAPELSNQVAGRMVADIGEALSTGSKSYAAVEAAFEKHRIDIRPDGRRRVADEVLAVVSGHGVSDDFLRRVDDFGHSGEISTTTAEISRVAKQVDAFVRGAGHQNQAGGYPYEAVRESCRKAVNLFDCAHPTSKDQLRRALETLAECATLPDDLDVTRGGSEAYEKAVVIRPPASKDELLVIDRRPFRALAQIGARTSIAPAPRKNAPPSANAFAESDRAYHLWFSGAHRDALSSLRKNAFKGGAPSSHVLGVLIDIAVRDPDGAKQELGPLADQMARRFNYWVGHSAQEAAKIISNGQAEKVRRGIIPSKNFGPQLSLLREGGKVFVPPWLLKTGPHGHTLPDTTARAQPEGTATLEVFRKDGQLWARTAPKTSVPVSLK